MTTAVDSSVLFDIFTADPEFSVNSLAALRRARTAGSLIACPVVWAEVEARFGSAQAMQAAMDAAEVRFDPFDQGAAELAGDLWRQYRLTGGRREHMVPDFLVGAHALRRGARLLSRDAGFYRRYFRGLHVFP